MAEDYRKFKPGRQSELIQNEELRKIFEATKHIVDNPGEDAFPEQANVHGAVWNNTEDNEIRWYNKNKKEWMLSFKDRFQITDHILNIGQPDDPVNGQLWIYEGVLMYWDGNSWQPVKAVNVDSSDINLAMFDDYVMLSPLNLRGNLVLLDNDEKFTMDKDCLTDPPLTCDKCHDSLCPKKSANCEHSCSPCVVSPKVIFPDDAMAQYIVPSVKKGRFFVDHSLNKELIKVNDVVFNYPKNKIWGKTPSWVHVNAGKVTGLDKRFVKINKDNPQINISPVNTEFYGYTKESIYGDFLIHSLDSNTHDYCSVPGGIVLNHDAAQRYDYILAVTFKFTWVRNSGKMSITCNKDISTSYYIGDFGYPLNVFANGYNLEDAEWDYDNITKVVSANVPGNTFDLQIMRSTQHEYGYLKEYLADGRGIIKLLNKFDTPLVFVNGEVIHPGDLEFDNDKIYVVGAKRNMVWSIIEMKDLIKNYNMLYEASFVTDMNAAGTNYVVKYDVTKIEPDSKIVLFVDGMLIRQNDIHRDDVLGELTVDGLMKDQEYIILNDKYLNLFDEGKLIPAFYLGRTDESLIYMNYKLISNETPVITLKEKDAEELTATNGEIKIFLTSLEDKQLGEYCTWNSYTKTWDALNADDIAAIKMICYTYENTLQGVKINVPYTDMDIFHMYAFNFAQSISNPLIIRNVDAHDDDEFTTCVPYKYDAGAIAVWLDGIRQYYIVELKDGTGFRLPKKFTGKLTYVIEPPETGSDTTCEKEILGPDDLVYGCPNVYNTEMSLYPGHLTVYVSGVRQPTNSWIILDNHTLIVKDKKVELLGDKSNYPKRTLLRSDGTAKEVDVVRYDEILIEKRQDYKKQERTFDFENYSSWDVSMNDYDLPRDMLETPDEVMIFVNGTFAGLRANIGYRLDLAKNCLSILSPDIIDVLSVDPLLKIFTIDKSRYQAWKLRTGKTEYVPPTKNKLTLEWR